MPAQTPQEFITSLQSGGVLLAKDDSLYFVPEKVLAKTRLENEFGGASFKGQGVLLVRNDVVHFVPQATLDNIDSKCKLPNEFGKEFGGISPAYFKADDNSPDTELIKVKTVGKIWKEFRNILSQFASLDGIAQAIYLNKAENLVGKTKKDLLDFDLLDGVSKAVYLAAESVAGGKPASKAEKFKQIMFVYDPTKTRILVSMVKGGRPSDR